MKIITIERPSSISVGLHGFHLHGFYFNLSFKIKLNLFLSLKCQTPFGVIVSDSIKLLLKLLSENVVDDFFVLLFKNENQR